MWKRLLPTVLGACALTSKAPPLEVHYYTPKLSLAEPAGPLSRTKVRIGRVSASSQLRSRIAYRTSPTEFALYEERRWAESPDTYVRRALQQKLAARGALVTGGQSLVLDVEIVAFEERRTPRPSA